MEIRSATERDVSALRELAAAAYRPYESRIGRPPAPVSADYLAEVRAGRVWVGVDEAGRIVGLLVLKPAADHLLLDNVAVAPAAQGLGLGRRLLDFADRAARRLGLREIRLYTNEAMTENLAHYPRHGYTETHRGEQDGYRRVFFRKSLGEGLGVDRTPEDC